MRTTTPRLVIETTEGGYVLSDLSPWGNESNRRISSTFSPILRALLPEKGRIQALVRIAHHVAFLLSEEIAKLERRVNDPLSVDALTIENQEGHEDGKL